MPFTLNHKASKPKIRKAPPRALVLDLSTHKLVETSSLPTPPLTGDSMAPQSGFKMFGWKKTNVSTPSPRSFHQSSSETPRPILRVRSENPPEIEEWEGKAGWNENRARNEGGRFVSKAPSVVVTQYEDQGRPSLSHRTSSRKSSRPTSPASTSFGNRIRAEQPLVSPLRTPPMSSHVTTPPAAYVSSFQTRAPPPPSPYRPTHERQRSRTLPEGLSMNTEYASRPPRHSSLFPAMARPGSGYGSDTTVTLSSSESFNTITDVPMLNIIPATPQEESGEFPKRRVSRESRGLEDSVVIDEREMEDVPLDVGLPSIDVNFDFSPFGHVIDIPEEDDQDVPVIMLPEADTPQIREEPFAMPTDPLPPSPPFNSYPSYPSFPSLPSEPNMPSFNSTSSIPSTTSSTSSSSLQSFPDVEEALGSMLASLSSVDSHDQFIQPEVREEKPPSPTWSAHSGRNMGLGLGLDLPVEMSITAPLSPRKRRPAPPPLNVKLANSTSSTSFSSVSTFDNTPVPHSAPARITSHRVPFYHSAKPCPSAASATSIHIRDLSFGSHYSNEAVIYDEDVGPGVMSRDRDSISLASEASDDDLHTASIISLTPLQRAGSIVRVSMSPGEEVIQEVGLAL